MKIRRSPTLGAIPSIANERRIMLSLITQNKAWSRIQLVLVQISVIGGLIDGARLVLELNSRPYSSNV